MSAVFLALVPWMQVSTAVQQNTPITLGGLAVCVLGGVLIHAAFLSLNTLLVSLLRLGKGTPEQGALAFACCMPAMYLLHTLTCASMHAAMGTRRALVLCGSQKTLPIAVTVLNAMAPMISGPVGLAVIPCVVSHLLQIVLDSFLVQRWRREPVKVAAQAA